MSVVPQTPAQVAAALRMVADDIAAMSDADRVCAGGFTVTVSIQPSHSAPDRPEWVDRLSTALYGTPGQRRRMPSGTWHHDSPRRSHRSGVDVPVFCGAEDPRVTALRAEVEALRAAGASTRPDGGAR